MRRPLCALAFLAALALPRGARAAVTVAVDPAAGAHPISPLIYGLNFPTLPQLEATRLTLGRWGGNSVTRYNYAIDTGNTAADYFFENIPGCFTAEQGYCQSPPADPQESSGANAFLKDMASKGLVALFTIPTIGWVAKAPALYGHPFACGCKGPGQDAYDPYDAPCGNGMKNGAPIDCGPPTNTSVAVDPAWAKAWVSYLVGKLGPANGKRIYALDNEPALWSSTHRDIRKTRLGYDELWQRMRDYAVAILEADPTAEIAGPAEWGWPNYFCSDADVVQNGCSASSPDRKQHGGEELMAWLLDQAKSYEQQNGKRILHYLDLHYYPQGGSGPQRTRSLWDPSYSDPSWIGDTIRLVPRMREWVGQHYPGTKLAVSEYDFYEHDQPLGAVAYAEVLGIFGREGLDAATAWSAPAPDQPAFAAYRLFRNFDGKGGAFASTSVKVALSGDPGVEAYAAVDAARMTVALASEKGGDTQVTVSLGNFEAGASATLYGNQGGAMIQKLSSPTVDGNAVTFTLPGSSIAMLVIDGKNPNDLPDGGAGTGGSGGAGTGASSSGGGSGAAGTGATSSGGGSGGADTGGGSSGGGCGCAVAGAPASLGLTGLASLLGLVAALRGRRRR
jgi:MYXO-CTERM domain-containing protein